MKNEPIKDGGPAFPQSITDYQINHGTSVTYSAEVVANGGGMTLRDYFMANAHDAEEIAGNMSTREAKELLGIGPEHPFDGLNHQIKLNAIVRRMIADAMLEERNKEQP